MDNQQPQRMSDILTGDIQYGPRKKNGLVEIIHEPATDDGVITEEVRVGGRIEQEEVRGPVPARTKLKIAVFHQNLGTKTEREFTLSRNEIVAAMGKLEQQEQALRAQHRDLARRQKDLEEMLKDFDKAATPARDGK